MTLLPMYQFTYDISRLQADAVLRLRKYVGGLVHSLLDVICIYLNNLISNPF